MPNLESTPTMELLGRMPDFNLYIVSAAPIKAPTNSAFLFSMCDPYNYTTNLNKIDFNNYFDTNNVTNMSYMFASCWRLISLDLSNFNTSKVTDMSGMFANCSSLTNLNISNFNIELVTNMTEMFYGINYSDPEGTNYIDISSILTVEEANNRGCNQCVNYCPQD